jgi:hypothetical protein
MSKTAVQQLIDRHLQRLVESGDGSLTAAQHLLQARHDPGSAKLDEAVAHLEL